MKEKVKEEIDKNKKIKVLACSKQHAVAHS